MHGYRDGAVRPVCACARMRRCGRRIVRSRRCRRTTSHVHSWSMRHAATRTWTRIDLFVLSLSPRCGPTGLLRGQGWHALSVLRYTSTSSGLQLLDLGTLISRSSLCARVWRERTCGLRYFVLLYPTKALIAQRSEEGQGPLSSACFSNPGTPRLCRGSDATRFTFVAGARPSLARQHGE